jgi:adenosylmethionine-8-amino-7-oxononanoate aminotransferase
MNSQKDIFEHLWFPFTCSSDIKNYPPIIIKKGSGVYLYDKKGNRYLDAIGSWWVSILGHNHPKIKRAIKKQLDKLEHIIMAGFISEPALKLSHLLFDMLPKGITRIFYSDNGSTAVEVALKIALKYWYLKKESRTLFVSLGGAYHGDTLGATSVGSIEDFHIIYHKNFKSFLHTDPPYCYRCPCNLQKETCNAECMESLEKILQQKHHQIAACIFEPILQGACGMRIYPPKVLKRIFAACKKYNIITIADEVATGFGRTGKLFACMHADVVPDIMCLAKGLSGGFLPFAATCVKEHIYNEFCGTFIDGKQLEHGHSFTGNPLGASAACEALSLIKKQNIPYSLSPKMKYFCDRLNEFGNINYIGDIRSIGFVGALEIVKNIKTKEPFPKEDRVCFKISQEAIKNGVLIRPLGNVIYFVPPFIIKEKEIDFMFDIVKKAIKKILKT